MTVSLTLHWWYVPMLAASIAVILIVAWPDQYGEFMGWPYRSWSIWKMITVGGLLFLAVGALIGGVIK